MQKKCVFVVFNFVFAFACVFSFSFLFFDFLFPLKYKKFINEYASLNGIDNALVASIIKVESRFNNKAVSNKGAVGLMQLMPSTAKMFADQNQDFQYENVLMDPSENIRLGTLYLNYLFQKYNDEITVLACYNAGEGTVLKWMDGDEYLKIAKIRYNETLNYVNTVRKLKKIYKIRLIF